MKRNAKSPNGRFFSRVLPIAAILLCLIVLLVNTGGDNVYQRLLSLKMPALFSTGENTHQPASQNTSPQLEITSIMDIDKNIEESIRVELLRTTAASSIDLSGSAPRILIYHTHATEAYTPTQGYEYEACGDWRTNDTSRSVIAVGERLAKLLSEKYGIAVVHDTENYEPPKLSTAYSRSLTAMERYKAKYPSLTMFIDLHRDAYGSHESGRNDYITIDGKQAARLMFVVGTGKGATGAGFDQMPDFTSNLALASALSAKLEGFTPGFTRNIRVKTGRYNQHVSNQCLLVEVGHNANTLQQALGAMDYLAAAIADIASIESVGLTSNALVPQGNPQTTPEPKPATHLHISPLPEASPGNATWAP